MFSVCYSFFLLKRYNDKTKTQANLFNTSWPLYAWA